MNDKTILLLSANPKGTDPLRLDQEAKEIKAGLKRSKYRRLFHIEQAEAVTPRDVQRALLEYDPQIVHFSGHGAGDPGIIWETITGKPQVVSGEALADLFQLFADQVECVVLNACYSEHQAQCIAQHIPSVLGMNKAIGDKAAIAYAVSFYDALGAGRTINFAHQLGCNAIKLMGIEESLTPVLLQSQPLSPKAFRLDQPQSPSTHASRLNQQPQTVPPQPQPLGQPQTLFTDLRLAQPKPITFNPTRLAHQVAPSPPPQVDPLTQSPPTPQGNPLAENPFSLSQGFKPQKTPSRQAHIFISYKRNVAQDEQVAHQIFTALQAEHTVFIDRTMPIGTQWMEQLDSEIKRADILIVLLSEAAVQSEMVMLEIAKAHHLSKQTGRPLILPVRLAYQAPFQYPLSEYLNPINWAFWRNESDTPALIHELKRAINGSPLSISTKDAKQQVMIPTDDGSLLPPTPAAQPSKLEKPEGTMTSQSQFYVVRAEDKIALETIAEEGVTLTIKGARQMGKSSLLIRVIDTAIQAGKKAVFLDFQMFDRETLHKADDFFYQFCLWLTDALDMDDDVDRYWQRPQGNRQRCTRYVQRHILPRLKSSLVLAMDEVESIFDTPFRTDFFGMLRSWHNQRATSNLWRKLDLALVTSTEPYQLIDDLNQSPFNVGEVLDLQDFSHTQVHDLNQRHGSPLNPVDEKRLMSLVNGHPYLVRRALYLVAQQRMTAQDLFTQATEDRGPFGDHLRYHLFRMYDKPELVKGLLQVIQQRGCPNEHTFFRLRGAGLIRRAPSGVVPRCALYAQYFHKHLNV